MKRILKTNISGLPYNNRFNLTQRGRHVFCSSEPKGIGLTAKVAPEPPFACPFQARKMGATASQVNRALYGLFKVKKKTKALH